MKRPVTLFTAQWADLPLDKVAELAAGWGFDGLEIACKSAHLDVNRALEEPAYLDSIRATLDRNSLSVWALSNHAQGQWEDPGMSRLDGAPRALAHIRSLLWDPPTAAFDSVFTERD